jgi:hypothetical protein
MARQIFRPQRNKGLKHYVNCQAAEWNQINKDGHFGSHQFNLSVLHDEVFSPHPSPRRDQSQVIAESNAVKVKEINGRNTG